MRNLAIAVLTLTASLGVLVGAAANPLQMSVDYERLKFGI